LLALTEAGKTALAAAVPIWRATHAAIERQMAGVDPDGLRAALAVCANI
jgi:hypothetical protein